MKAIMESFRVSVQDGVLNLYFSKGSADLAAVKAIEIYPVTSTLYRAAASPETTSTIRTYPNPAKDQLIVELPFPLAEIKTSSISDTRGQRLQINSHQAAGDRQLQLDVSSLRAGLYLLRMEAASGSCLIKFIKQ